MNRIVLPTGLRAAVVSSLIGIVCGPALRAQEPPNYLYGASRPPVVDRGSSAVWQDLQKLKTRGSLMFIVAHPDDEDGALLAYESRDRGVYTSLLTLNRGEGGQNLMSNDLWDRLGLVRTQELLAAGEAYGVHQYFTRVADYGFSKTLEEAMQQWGHDRVLYDVVRVVRMMVLATGRSSPPQTRRCFPTRTHSPVRFRDYVHNSTIEGFPPATLAVTVSNYNPFFGDSPQAIARVGLGNQKSQNGGTAAPLPRPSASQYHLYATRVSSTTPTHEDNLFEGIDTSLEAIASYAPAEQQAPWRERLKALDASVQSATASFDAANPAKSAPALAKGLSQTVALIADVKASALPAEAKYNIEHELDIKRDQKSPTANSSLTPATAGPAGDFRDQAVSVTVPATAELTKPYFSRKTVEQSYYDITDPRYLNMPTTPYPLAAEVTYKYGGAEAHLSGVVQATHRYVGPGPVLEPLLVAPAISLTVSPQAGVVPVGNATLHLQVKVHSSAKGAAEGSVKLDLPEGWTSNPAAAPFNAEAYNDERIVNFTITPKGVQQKRYTITAVADSGGKTYKEGFEMAGYVGLRPYPFYRPSTYQTTGVDLKVAPGLKVAYIMGTGDDVPASLEDIGIHVTMLSSQDIATADLSSYDAIILGIRTYSARPELARANARLLNYAKAGGTVIVQYQSTEFNAGFTPYPFTLGGNGERVVEEDNKATILLPNDPVLNFPNHIKESDFDGWIEERGHGFPQSWDPQFVALTEMHDAGQDPQKGGLLYAHYGKGAYVYMAYAFFRQMPEGVPGSFRIMANLISIGKNPQFKASAPAAK